MMNNTLTQQLAIRNETSHLTQLGLPDLFKLAEILVPTGFLPKAISTPAQAAAVILKGQELRIPPMYALSNINIIQGKPGASAELMLALIYRDQGDDALVFMETSESVATAKYKRRGWREYQTFSFTMQDAKRANLSDGNWTKYPGAMLRARCISAVARLAFPDSIGGMYTPEELGATVDIETDEILDAPMGLELPHQHERPGPVASEPQIRAIYTLAEKGLGLSETEIEHRCKEMYGRLPRDLTRRDASEFIDSLKRAAAGARPIGTVSTSHSEPAPEPKSGKTRAWEPSKVWPKLRNPLPDGPTLTNDQVHRGLGVESLDDYFQQGGITEVGQARLMGIASAMISGDSFEDALAAVTELEATSV